MGNVLTYSPVIKSDYDLLFDLHKASLGPYIDQIFGWEENLQRQYFSQQFDMSQYDWIWIDQFRIGAVSYRIHPDRLHLERIEIYPAFQRQGYGSRVIADILSQSEERDLPVELQVFKINPAIALYKRLGFVPTGETNIHVQMRRSPKNL